MFLKPDSYWYIIYCNGSFQNSWKYNKVHKHVFICFSTSLFLFMIQTKMNEFSVIFLCVNCSWGAKQMVFPYSSYLFVLHLDQKYVNIPFSKRVDIYGIDYSPEQATNVCLGVANY